MSHAKLREVRSRGVGAPHRKCCNLWRCLAAERRAFTPKAHLAKELQPSGFDNSIFLDSLAHVRSRVFIWEVCIALSSLLQGGKKLSRSSRWKPVNSV
jgi:hypothetical protein